MIQITHFSDGGVELSFYVFFIYTLWAWKIYLPPGDDARGFEIKTQPIVSTGRLWYAHRRLLIHR